MQACRTSDGASWPNADRVTGRPGLGQEALPKGNGSCGASGLGSAKPTRARSARTRPPPIPAWTAWSGECPANSEWTTEPAIHFSAYCDGPRRRTARLGSGIGRAARLARLPPRGTCDAAHAAPPVPCRERVTAPAGGQRTTATRRMKCPGLRGRASRTRWRTEERIRWRRPASVGRVRAEGPGGVPASGSHGFTAQGVAGGGADPRMRGCRFVGQRHEKLRKMLYEHFVTDTERCHEIKHSESLALSVAFVLRGDSA